VPRASAALVTTAAEQPSDVLGARSADELADMTWIVTRALGNVRPLVLNADDATLVVQSARMRGPIVWYSVNPEHKLLAAHAERGGTIWTIRDGMLGYQRGRPWRDVASVSELARAGATPSQHELANALAAAALASALGLPDRAIATGLRASDPAPAKAQRRA
jgi:UDP-N-acetylmuramyl tripeptide synthase